MRTVTVIILSTLMFIACGRSKFSEPPAAQDGFHETAAWILACRVHGQGFGCFPGDSAFITRTGMAVEALGAMDLLDEFQDRERLIAWILSKQNEDGGFREADNYYGVRKLFDDRGFMDVEGKQDAYGPGANLPWGTTSALEPTWWAVKTLGLLGAEIPQADKMAKFVAVRQLPEAAFSSYELGWNETRTKSMAYSTFWAVAILKELGRPVPDSAKVVEFLQQLQSAEDGPGGFRLGDLQFTVYNVQATYYAVAALKLLGAGPIRPDASRRFLLSSYGQEPDGGFECGHGDGWNHYDHYSRTIDTHAAVLTLELLGAPLSDSDSSRASRPASDCIAWLGSVQNPDGGFARFGVTGQTPVPSPSEMAATWHAVMTLRMLGSSVPRPANPVSPVNEVKVHLPKYLYPSIRNHDPVDVWAYRRIALPIHEYLLEKTGSRIAALHGLSRWARAAVSPVNAAFCVGGRSLLMHGFGQCAQMSLMTQQLAASVDYPARYSMTFGNSGGDVNCEIYLQEDGWDRPHWCLFIPFGNDYIDPSITTPEGANNGWSVLDCTIDYKLSRRKLQFASKANIGDHCFLTVRVETVNYETGEWGKLYNMDTTTTYQSEIARELYPGESW